MVEPNENFVIFWTLFVLSFSLPKFLPHFGVKPLFMLLMLLIAFQSLSSIIRLHISAFLGRPLTIITCTPSILPISFFFNLMSTTNFSLDPCSIVSLGIQNSKGYRYYDLVSHHFHVSRNTVFWDNCSFVELSHFRSSLSTSYVKELLPNKSHIPSIITFDPPIDFSIQPPDIFEHVEDEQVKDVLPNFEPGSLAPAPLEDLAQDIPSRHSTWVRSILAHYLTIIVTLPYNTTRASHLS